MEYSFNSQTQSNQPLSLKSAVQPHHMPMNPKKLLLQAAISNLSSPASQPINITPPDIKNVSVQTGNTVVIDKDVEIVENHFKATGLGSPIVTYLKVSKVPSSSAKPTISIKIVSSLFDKEIESYEKTIKLLLGEELYSQYDYTFDLSTPTESVLSSLSSVLSLSSPESYSPDSDPIDQSNQDGQSSPDF